MIMLLSATHHADYRLQLYLTVIALIEYSAIIGATVSLGEVLWSLKPREALRLPCALLLITLSTCIVHFVFSACASDKRLLVRYLPDRPVVSKTVICMLIFGALVGALGLL